MAVEEYIQASHCLESLNDFYRYGRSKGANAALFFGHGTENLADDLRWLLTSMLSLPFDLEEAQWLAKLLPEEKQSLARALHARIEEQVPVAYLVKEAFFCGLSFYVDERVLIPRSPLAECIAQQFQPWVDPDKVRRILDLCTGSGCIALACAEYFPNASVVGVDLSADALAVANHNLARLQKEEKVQFLASDCWQNVPQAAYDIIVSNPPYVSTEEMQELPAEYSHEPRMALEAAQEGLAIVAEILEKAAAYLAPEGILLVEVGNSAEALQKKYPKLPFLWLEFERGGDFVFLLTAAQLQQWTKDRKK